MDAGWRMKEIDEMDMLGFYKIRAWNAKRKTEKKESKQGFIDTVWPGMRSR